MTRLRAWADGSAARLDVDQRGLALTLRDPAGQVAAVQVDSWRAMHAGHSGVQGYARFAVTDGSMHEVRIELPDVSGRRAVELARTMLAAVPTDPDTHMTTEPLGPDGTRTTIVHGLGAGHGGSTTVIDNDGHGTITRTDTATGSPTRQPRRSSTIRTGPALRSIRPNTWTDRRNR